MKKRRRVSQGRGVDDVPWWAIVIFAAMGLFIVGLFVWGAFFYNP